jgi:hypothetical protein
MGIHPAKHAAEETAPQSSSNNASKRKMTYITCYIEYLESSPELDYINCNSHRHFDR